MLSNDVKKVLSNNIKRIITSMESNIDEEITAICIRVNRPLCVRFHSHSVFVNRNGKACEAISAYHVAMDEIKEMLNYMSQYSLYAYENEMREGFITIKGGHRIGIVGQPTIVNGEIRTFSVITGFHIRIAHEQFGCAIPVYQKIMKKGLVCHTLIVSPPGCGKTTMLRDLTRMLASDGSMRSVCVIDERGEIAACSGGIPNHDIGDLVDVMDLCPKQIGMMMAIRSMAPDVLVVDEIGGEGDDHAILSAMHSGISIIASVHGYSLEDVKRKTKLHSLPYFERFIILSNIPSVGTIQMVMNQNGQSLMGGM